MFFFLISVDYLKSLWYKMRKRFVEVNLKKSRGEKVSPAQELFYEYLIFLEDHITHKNDEVYRSINKREIIDKIFDHLMGNTFEDVDDVEDIIDEFNIEDFPDAREILHPIDNDFEDEFIFPDTENLEMLEGYEEVVIDSLLKTRKSEEVKQIEKEEASILVAENVIKLDKLKIIEKNKAYKTKEYPVKTAKNPLNKLTNKPLVSLIDEPKKK